MNTNAPEGAPLGLWGGFDLESLGEQLRLRVVRHELARRRPDLAVRAFAPFGSARPIPLAEGDPVEALDPVGDHLRGHLATTLSAVVVTGELAHLRPAALARAYGESAASAAERTRFLLGGAPPLPLAWHAFALPADLSDDERALVSSAASEAAHVSARDDVSRDRLVAAGVGTGRDVAVVGDPAILAPRVLPASLLEQRLEFLIAMRWWPTTGTVALVQGSGADADRIAGGLDALATTLSRHAVTLVVVEADGVAGDGRFADTFDACLGDAAIRMPALAGVEDRVAAVAAADLVVASSGTLLALADAYGRPAVPLDAAVAGDLTPRAAGDVGATGSALDAEYDVLAALVPPGTVAPLVTSELLALRAALGARGRRLAAERLAMADHAWKLRGESEGLLAQRDAYIAALEAENALLRSRLTIKARAAVGRAVRRLGRRR